MEISKGTKLLNEKISYKVRLIQLNQENENKYHEDCIPNYMKDDLYKFKDIILY